MSDRIDPEKKQRIDFETQFISFEMIDLLSKTILDELTKWANETIYKPLGGTLTLERPLNESVNACASLDRRRPLHATIKINMGMIREIYRDAFVFPPYCEQFVLDSPNIKDLNDQFGNLYFTFGSGLPEIPHDKRNKLFDAVKDVYVGKDPRWTENVVASRFMYFEITLAWVFFHELSHLVQCHYLLKSDATAPLNNLVEHYEIRESSTDSAENIKEQAREVLADIEGIEFTVDYMIRSGIFSSASMYLLMCSLGCMFNRFYERYGEVFEFGASSHPHPVLRNEFSVAYITNSISQQLIKQKLAENKEHSAPAIVYLSVRASLVSGLYWAWRYEKFDGGKLTSFMKLSTNLLADIRKESCRSIQSAMNLQLATIGAHHLSPNNFLLSLSQMPPFFSEPNADKDDNAES